MPALFEALDPLVYASAPVSVILVVAISPGMAAVVNVGSCVVRPLVVV